MGKCKKQGFNVMIVLLCGSFYVLYIYYVFKVFNVVFIEWLCINVKNRLKLDKKIPLD